MSTLLTPPVTPVRLPNHMDLPCEDGAVVENFAELPQRILLTDSIGPVLQALHPDGHYIIGHDSGIYWDITDPPLEGVRAPDWFCVEGVPPLLDGKMRRSYVLWQELIAPTVLLEFVSGDGTEELDATPRRGKFWVYEQAVHAPYYGVWFLEDGQLRVFRLVDNHYVRMEPNENGRYPIAPLGVDLGVWQGRYQNLEIEWLRWWDSAGNLLLTGNERADQERQQKERLAERLRALGVDPDTV